MGEISKINIGGVDYAIRDKVLEQKLGDVNAKPMISVTYTELVTLRDNGKLIAGMQYRITDYVTTTAQENTQSAGHAFDVIVMATDSKTLSEEARAIVHDGDTYFTEAGANLAAWKLWYCLDNDAERFAWADAENGKGVIFRMIDEWENDVPYDFKNIMFKREIYANGAGIAEAGYGDYNAYCYTFSWEDDDNVIMDASLVGNNGYLLNDEDQITGVFGNLIKPYITYSGEVRNPQKACQYLNNIVFLSNYAYEERWYYGCHSNSFGNNCASNSLGNNCSSNSFGNDCYDNSFGNNCSSNSFGNDCSDNSFGNNCYKNSLGNNCYDNSLGNNCSSNSFGNDCYGNSFGNNCYKNSLGNNCSSNSFGNNCSSNSFGNDCYDNSFSYENISVTSYVRGCTFGDICENIKIIDTETASSKQQLQFVRVCNGSSNITAQVSRGRNYETLLGKDSTGEIKKGCLLDLIKSEI